MSVNLHPSLETQIKGHGRNLFASATSAVICCGAVCGALALIISGAKIITEDEFETAEPLMVHHETSRKVQQEEAKPVPLNLISVTTSPHKINHIPPQPKSAPPREELAPSVESVVIQDMEFEELEFDNPFAQSKPAPKKSTPTKNTASGTTIAKKPSTSDSKRRTASLAKKITKQASLLSRSTPSYPRSARRQGLEGRVIVTVTIGSSGKVASSYVSQSCGHPSLDSSALAAARKFRFKPAINGLGQYVSVKRAIPFNFQITG